MRFGSALVRPYFDALSAFRLLLLVLDDGYRHICVEIDFDVNEGDVELRVPWT